MTNGIVALLAALALAASAAAQTDPNSANRVTLPENQQPGIVDTVLKFVGPIPAGTTPRPERFSEFLLSTLGPVPILGEAAGAGIEQWMNSPEEWGQGWGAFGKRFGSNMAYNGIRQSITYGGSLALHEDTRYFSSGSSGVWPRLRHALVSTFAAHHADGREYFSVSGTAGVLGASAISSVWGPPAWKGPGNIAENAGLSFAATAGSNIAREFLPDILHRKK